MSTSEHLFIHPWLHPDESWAGFQVSFAGPDESYGAALAALSVDPRMHTLDHRLLWFVPLLNPECVAAATTFPDSHSVLFLRPHENADDRESWAHIEADLRRTGRRLGLMLKPNAPLPPTGAWSHVIVAASQARTLSPYSLIGLATKTAIAVTGLHSRNDFMWATSNQCTLVTGEYLLNRSTPSNRPDMMRLRLLKLLALIVEDADTSEIEEIFRQEPKLAYGLLRLVNSAAMAPRSPITSFGQAITILGRQQLQRWLQLLVYADPNNNQHPNPLLLQAAMRGRLMEILAARIQPPPEPDLPLDTAFMVGTFSLLDVLLNLPMSDILLQLPLPESIHAALDAHRGPLGQLLMALAAADGRDLDGASKGLASLGIDRDTFTAAQMSALEWASQIRSPT